MLTAFNSLNQLAYYTIQKELGLTDKWNIAKTHSFTLETLNIVNFKMFI